ncbi:MAG: hypothetical protein CVV33_05350, partial [Methanomicrobiales archaeon HGW-Methanomicrobiales-4]
MIVRLIKYIFPEYQPEKHDGSFFTRRKIILSMFLFISITAIIFINYNSLQILESYDNIEVMNMDSSLHLLQNTLTHRGEILEKTARDYAQWDDTARYVLTHDISYETENLNPQSLKNLGITFVAVLNASGQIFYIKRYEPVNYEEIPTPEKDVIISALQIEDAGSSSSILHLSDEDLLLVSQVMITPSNTDGPSVGFLIFGIPLHPIIDETISNTGIPGASTQIEPLPDRKISVHTF